MIPTITTILGWEKGIVAAWTRKGAILVFFAFYGGSAFITQPSGIKFIF